MCEVSVKGVVVSLPRPLRPQQKEFMDACMDCFSEGKIGMLESTNATGRTESLLCTSLGWLLQNSEEKSTKYVLYLSSSDQNMERVISEYYKTCYAGLGMDLFTKSSQETSEPTPRIIFSKHDNFFQELISVSSSCPSKFDFPNTLVIIDDSHLIEDASRDAASAKLSLCKIDQTIQELSKEIDKNSKITLPLISKLEQLKNLFRGIRPHYGGESDPTYGDQEIIALFRRINLDESDMLILKDHPKACEVLQFISRINIFCLTDVMRESSVDHTEQNYLESFKMYVSENCSKAERAKICTGDRCKTLNFLCLDPSLVVRRMIDMKPHSIIFTSTTIAPFHQLKDELGILESKEFISKSIIEDHQIFARIVTCGAGGYYLNSSYKTRFDEDYLTSVGRSILEVAKVTPNGQGMLVYFASYECLDFFKSHWKTYKVKGQILWQIISEQKDIFAVSSHDVSFCDLPERLNSPAVKKKGCCILTVLRGEVSKDTSISIDHKRVIIIVGVPYPPSNDTAIQLKKNYNIQKGRRRLPGVDFLEREAYKAINLTTNHQINLSSEYGVILLFDTRLRGDQLSLWLKDQIKSEKRFTEMLQELNDFFNTIERRTKWTMATSEDPAQSSSQFGRVQSWEMEKLRLDYIRQRKTNASLENYLQTLRKRSLETDSKKEALEKKLAELHEKEMTMNMQGKPQSSDNPAAGDLSSSITQQGNVLSEVCVIVSPVRSDGTPRKRRYPE